MSSLYHAFHQLWERLLSQLNIRLSQLAEMAYDIMGVASAVINAARTSHISESDLLRDTVKYLAAEVANLRLND